MKNKVIPPKFIISMKKILATLAIGLALTTAAFAQPTINIVPPAGDPPCTGEEVCVDVIVANFTDILSTRFFIQWDSTVLQFNNTQSYNLPNMGPGNFTQVSNGRLLVVWESMDNVDCNNPTAMGVTVADDMVIFQVCFTALGNYGAATDIIIPATASPLTPDIKRKGAGCTNIGIEDSDIDTALVSSCVRPFIIDISDEQGNEGDLVCIDFRVFGMDALTSFQFPIVWDPNKAAFENIVISQNLPNLALSSFGVPGQAAGVLPGSVTVSWNAPVPNNGLSLPDSTVIFQLCLRLRPGSCNMIFPVGIGAQQPGQPSFRPEASNDFQSGFNDIAVGQFAGEVAVGPCNPTGLQLSANCGPAVEVNDQICIPVLAGSNFQNVTDLSFLIEWNPNILSFTGTQNQGLPGGITFNTANSGNGILGMAWDGNPSNRNNGDVLFEVCFDVIGLGGNSPFTFINNEDDVAQINNGPNIGINPTNCEISVNQPAGVFMEITDDLQGRPGDTLCFDFFVYDFTEVESMQFSLAFEPTEIEYILAGGLQNLTLPGATAANFNFFGVSGGQITFTWTAPSPVTLSPGEQIFTLCFRVPDSGTTPGFCDLLDVVDVPLEAEVITTGSNGENVGLIDSDSRYCILSPEGFYLDIGNVTGDIQDTLCVPVKVSEFVDITSGNFTINWNPGALALTAVNDMGAIPGLNIGQSGQPVGNVDFDFNAPAGLSLVDSTLIFEMCFELLGPPDSCFAVTVSETPQATVTTLNGDGSLLDIPGEVCINDRLFIVETIINPETCPGSGDGSARVVVEGGRGPYIYSWETQPPQFLDSARFLSEGFVVVTILDQSAPPLKITDTLYINALGADLFVNAGPDKVSSCDPPCTFVSPQASQGPNIMYTWTASQGGQVCSNPNDRVLLGRGPGKFVIEVKDINTGCSVTDEVLLTPPVFPTAEAGDSPSLTCVRDEVTLDASGSTRGDTIQYTWRGPNNNIIAGPSNAAITAIGQDTGFYFLEVEIATTGCVSRDSVEVVRDTIAPPAVASPGTDTTFLGCNEMATLTGFAGDNTDNLSYAWVDSNGDTLTTDSVYMTNQVGTFTFQVLNELNGCFNSDNTVVVIDSAVAVVNIVGDPTPDFTCNGQNVTLEGIVTNITPDAFTFEWMASNGAAIEPGTEVTLFPEITSPGTIELIVTSDQTGCVSAASIEVGTNTDPPAVAISMPDTLTCVQESVILDASGSAQNGAFRYEWRYVDLNLQVGTGLTAETALEGTYIFSVLDTISGCSAADTIRVVRDTLGPDFSAGFPEDLTCLNETTEVRTFVNLPDGTFTVQWTAVDGGNIVSGANDTVTVFDAAGTYELEVTDNSTGCSATLARVIESFQDYPVADISNETVMITCVNDLDTLDASLSTPNDTIITVTYQWNAIEGTITGDPTRNFLPVSTPGIFEFVVTNVNSQCVTRDTAYVFEDRDEPVANAGDPLTLACISTEGMLDGSGSTPPGGNIVYFWTNEDSDTIGTDVMLPVTLPGVYVLTVLNTANGCVDNDAVAVSADGEPAQIVFEAPTNAGLLDLDCTLDTVAVSFRIANDTVIDVNNLVFTWGGDILTTADPFTVQVYTGGTFTLMATDTTSGCVGTNELVVTDLRDLPAIAIESTGEINCIQDMVMLSGEGSAVGDSIQYQWLDPNGMEVSTTLQANATFPGTYQLIVTNTNTSCTASETIDVAEDTAPPALIFDTTDTTFQCRDESLLVIASDSGLPGNFSEINWSSVSGGVVTPIENTLTASVNGPGTYQLQLVSSANGCDTTATISIAADTLAPSIALAEPPLLGCPGQTVSLDASQSGSPSDFETISWSTASGSGTASPAAGSLVVDVNDAGTYLVTLVSADNGCEATQEVVVELDPNAPVAEATASNTVVGCGETVMLDGSASSQGAIYDYQWVSLSGGAVTPNPGNETMATVTAAGTYQLIVFNMQTMCSDTSAAVELALDPSLVAAAASQDAAACGDDAPISGNAGALPANTTGRWTSLSGAIIAEEGSPSTTVSGLQEGENILIWSLSQDGCANYSSDTLVVIPEKAPDAVIDELVLERGENSATLDVTANDQLLGVSDWTVSVITDPSLGRVTDEGNGSLNYTLSISLLTPASDEFTYEICNALCPELCSQAMVEVAIERDTTGKFDVPNGITPNGDGLNDALIFDQLLLNPEDYPDNELIIFNRWGDIVFEAKPYNNDWQGQSSNGDELPDGTYYYVLRLNIGEGEILRGDITVIKAVK